MLMLLLGIVVGVVGGHFVWKNNPAVAAKVDTALDAAATIVESQIKK
jgi:hypothetical protein